MKKTMWLNLNLKLSQQLLGSFVGAGLLLQLSSLGIAYVSIRSNLNQQVYERARAITQGLEYATEGLIETQDQVLLERVSQNYATLPAVIEVAVIDPSGTVIARSRPHSSRQDVLLFADAHPELFPSFTQVSRTGQAMTFRTTLEGKSVLVDMLPFSSTLFFRADQPPPSLTQRRGAALVIMNLETMERVLYESFIGSLRVVLAGTVLLLLFMALVLNQYVFRPLGLLNSAIHQSQRQRQFHLPPLPNNEIGFFGQTLSQALTKISNYQKLELEIAERKYQEIAQRYSLATRATKVWIWDWRVNTDELVIDKDFQAWLNPAAPHTPWPLATFSQFIAPEDRPGYLAALDHHLLGHTSEFSYEHRLVPHNSPDNPDPPRWFLCKGQAVRAASGEALQVIGTIADITELKTAQTELLQTNAALQRATRLKDEFLANMSHELRTPLNAILGMTESLKEAVFGEINNRQLNALNTIETSANHLLLLINDILDVAKIEAGQIELEYGFVSPSELCRSSLQFIEQQAMKKHLKLTTQISQLLPEIWLDQRRMRQVLINLLSNAVKFTPEGGRVMLMVNCWQDPDAPKHPGFLRFTVKDTGIGIAATDIPRLFQPFSQIDSALNRQYTGTGLGLTLVKQIVDLHQGQVGLTSEVGQGSQFTVDLPYITPNQPQNQALRLTDFPPSLGPSSPPLQSPLILIAEDNESNILTISSYLKAKGYRFCFAHSGREAVAKVKSEKPDLVLMDIQMPEMDGLAAMREIRQTLHLDQIPIIAMTALTMEGDRERCLAAGATDYLSKPVKLSSLSQMIQSLLSV